MKPEIHVTENKIRIHGDTAEILALLGSIFAVLQKNADEETWKYIAKELYFLMDAAKLVNSGMKFNEIKEVLK